jgi:hypothetical protein
MTSPTTARTLIEVTLPESFSPGWDCLDGVAVDGPTLRIDPAAYFYRYENPTWLLCGWDDVRRDLLATSETPDQALEQRVLDYVRAHGRQTSHPADVLATAWQVYAHLFRNEHLADPGLAHVDQRHPRILREVATVMALNRVELSGEITNVGPAWFFADVARVVFGLDEAESMALDELYHGGFFNEARRVESIKAHAALGGRLVHGCQSSPDMSGGVVAPYGVDVARFAAELNGFKDAWRAAIHAKL